MQNIKTLRPLHVTLDQKDNSLNKKGGHNKFKTALYSSIDLSRNQ